MIVQSERNILALSLHNRLTVSLHLPFTGTTFKNKRFNGKGKLPPKTSNSSKTHVDGQGNPNSNEPVSGGENEQKYDTNDRHQNLNSKKYNYIFSKSNKLYKKLELYVQKQSS